MSVANTPAGQPKAYPRTRRTTGATKKPLPVFVYPHDVMMVRSKESLERALEHFSHPFPMMDGSPMPQNKDAYRHYVEWVRPTLRWFCKVYGKEIPAWLEGNGSIEKFSHADKQRFLGTTPLNVQEWHENTKAKTRG